MIKKWEIINVLIDEGLSIVESDRTLDTVENFRLCVQDVEEKAVNERLDPIIKLIERFPKLEISPKPIVPHIEEIPHSSLLEHLGEYGKWRSEVLDLLKELKELVN